jgi:hypothetical protein
MNDDLGVVQGSRIRPLGKFLLIAAAALSVGILIYAIFTQGMNWSVRPDADSGRSRIDLNALHDIPPEASASPVPLHAVIPDMVQPMPQPTPAVARQPHVKSALEMWREMEALKAREAPVMFPEFGDSKNVQEIASKGTTGDLSHYHEPAGPYTIMEGSHLTASLISGIDSDYPGPITAQVLQAVYDTASGRYLLIPPGAKLLGQFESPARPLQERIAIKWHRIIFPDTSSVDLPDAPSTDQQGYAGMTGDVDSHHLAAIGAGLLMTVFSLGPSVGSAFAYNSAQGSPYNGGIYASDPQQQLMLQASNSAGGQMNAHAGQALSPYLTRPKTITIFPGAVIDVFVTRDLVLGGPYQDKAGQTVTLTTAQPQGDTHEAFITSR